MKPNLLPKSRATVTQDAGMALLLVVWTVIGWLAMLVL